MVTKHGFDVEATLDKLAEVTSLKIGQSYFDAVVNFLAEHLGVSYAIIGEVDMEFERVDTIAVHAHGKIIDNVSYHLAATPCSNVLEDKACCYDKNVQALFPEDLLLQDMGAESYLGAPLVSISGEKIGILILLDTKPMLDPEPILFLFNFIGQRIAAEFERRNALKLLQTEEEKFRDLILCSSDIIWEVDENFRYTFSSSTTDGILGYDAEEIIGKSFFDFLEPTRMGRIQENCLNVAANRENFKHCESYLIRKDGCVICVETSGVPIYDETGAFKGYRGLDRDISDRKAYQERITYQANHDSLTGLANRIYLESRFKKAIDTAIQDNTKGALLFIDLDRFKQVNDSLGHFVGDILIKAAGARIKEQIRDDDIAARLGGDEFAVIMPNIDDETEAAFIAQNIIDAIAKPFHIESNELFVSASIGITLYPDDGDGVEKLLSSADAAMYKAKEAGRNTLYFFTEAMRSEAVKRYELVNALHKAVINQSFNLHFQPIVDADTQQVIGCEALLRWYDDVFGQVSPVDFIPLAEETGLIEAIGHWVIDKTCETFSDVGDLLPPNFFVSVNVSSFQFQSGKLVPQIKNAIMNNHFSAHKLVIEITESVMLNDDTFVLKQLQALKDAGFSISIDDFGTGFSSLSYLNKYPICSLKIDRAFVQGINGDDKNRKLVKAILAMSDSLGLRTIAEGIEENLQADFLKSNHCTALQGYLFGKPMPFNELMALIAQESVLEPESI